MSNNSYKIVPYESSYYESFKKLSESFPEFQPSNYIYHTQEIFEYLYRGFGHNDSSSLIIINNNNEVLGFRGAIPSLYQLPIDDSNYEIIKGNGITGWIMKQDTSLPKGIGLKLHTLVQESSNLPVAACFGGETSLQVYKMNKFNIIDNLNRYVIPLNNKNYKSVINSEHDSDLIDIWSEEVDNSMRKKELCKPNKINANELEKLWIKVSKYKKIFGLYKNRDYWNWRYINCPYYEYLFFGDPKETGIIIARIEKIFNFKNNSTIEIDKNDSVYNKKIFRIIEIIPSDIEPWKENISNNFNSLLLSVLNWAKSEGCIAADFQFSNVLFNKQLANAGFKNQNAQYEPPECSLAGLFQPYKQKVYPINVAWKLNHENISREDFKYMTPYFTKSDVAGDYPKYWPRIL